MNVFILSNGQDTCGQGLRIKQAFDKYTDWNVRAMHRKDFYFKWGHDARWDENLAQQLFDAAGVVHLKNGTALYHRFDHGQRKPAVVHHQGTMLRNNPESVSAQGDEIGAVQLVSTVDLLADCPGSIWLPGPHDLDWIRDKYTRKRTLRRLRVGHAPTNHAAKATGTIIGVIDELQPEYGFDFDLIERLQWVVCLSRKGACDVFIDQLTLGYGNNAVEAMAMGIPVISGWAEAADRERFLEQTGEEPPFVEANDVESLADALRRLLESPALRKEWGERGRAFAEKFHSEEAVVARLKPIYESMVQRSPASSTVIDSGLPREGFPLHQDEYTAEATP